VLLRNDGGELRAFVNACAHRHARVTGEPRGNAVRLRCQYHGWEYDGRGAVCKIPDAACFVPVKRGSERLTPLRTATLGALVFVSLAEQGPTLEEHLGVATTALAARVFPAGARPIVDTAIEHPCNWKIPLENVLESYHVPFLHDNVLARHPEVFRVFGGRRDGGLLAHELGERHTAYHDSLGADSRAYRALLGVLRPSARVDYVHHHAFPNVVIGHTSIVSYLQVVEPLSPTTSRSTIRLFLDVGGRGARAVERVLAPLLDRAAEGLIRRVMAEDAAVYPDVQRGMSASPHRGVLGSREERVHHFQAWIAAELRA
jgi:phenylpropionate dioxygenase-like ring-hydroxylating dioxygenase large terminal subunit